MKYVIAIWTLLFSVNVFAQTVVLRWGSNPGAGQITVVNGELEKINSRGGKIQKIDLTCLLPRIKSCG